MSHRSVKESIVYNCLFSTTLPASISLDKALIMVVTAENWFLEHFDVGLTRQNLSGIPRPSAKIIRSGVVLVALQLYQQMFFEKKGATWWFRANDFEKTGFSAVTTMISALSREMLAGKVVENRQLYTIDSFTDRWDMLFRGENDSERMRIGVNRVSEKGRIFETARCPNCCFHRVFYVFQQKRGFGVILKRIWGGRGAFCCLKRPRPFAPVHCHDIVSVNLGVWFFWKELLYNENNSRYV